MDRVSYDRDKFFKEETCQGLSVLREESLLLHF